MMSEELKKFLEFYSYRADKEHDGHTNKLIELEVAIQAVEMAEEEMIRKFQKQLSEKCEGICDKFSEIIF